jgi:hypothetical protein
MRFSSTKFRVWLNKTIKEKNQFFKYTLLVMKEIWRLKIYFSMPKIKLRTISKPLRSNNYFVFINKVLFFSRFEDVFSRLNTRS